MIGCQIGIDVGGTFTDFVLIADSGEMVFHKEPSRPADPSAAVISGIDTLLANAQNLVADINLVVHGTTLALNAIVQRAGGRIGLVVSEGFGDMLVIGRGDLPNAFSYKEPKRPPIIPRQHVFEIPARVRPDGTVTARPLAADLDAVAARVRAAGLEALAVLVVNSYAHPALELELATALAERLPDLMITPSAQLWPEIREYERALVATLNAYVHPMMDSYYGRLAERLSECGVAAPTYITTSSGGTVSLQTARARPIETLLSGPAAGVVATARLAGARGVAQIVTFDMGGTSSDISILRSGAPELAMETRIGEFPIIVPAVDVWAIGAGGGSVLWVDAEGVLKVGPRSAGADPGPVSYGRGGREPTITDCYLALGLIDPRGLLGGRMPLDRQAAMDALTAIGSAIGITGDDAAVRTAAAATRIATARMATEVSKGMAQRGLDPAAFTLAPYGGAGPTHACFLAEEAGLSSILVPPSPGTFCARGAVLADVRREFVQSHRMTLDTPSAADSVRGAVEELERAARQWIADEGDLVGEVSVTASAAMQYPRTATETTIVLPDATWRRGDSAALAELFHQEHERIYGFRDAESAVDITTLRLRVSGAARMQGLPERSARQKTRPAASGVRAVYWAGEWIEASLYHESDLKAGACIDGPAIVELASSTIWISPLWRTETDRFGAVQMTRA